MNEVQTKIKLFIVDDHDAILKMLKKMLSRNEVFEIYAYDSGEACINNMSLTPEVIILDYELAQSGGKLNGMDVVKKIQEMGQNPKIIMLTGQDNGKTVLELINKGVRDYIIKDENAFSELNEVINEFLKEKASGGRKSEEDDL